MARSAAGERFKAEKVADREQRERLVSESDAAAVADLECEIPGWRRVGARRPSDEDKRERGDIW